MVTALLSGSRLQIIFVVFVKIYELLLPNDNSRDVIKE